MANATMKDAEAFYDSNFPKKLINDYLKGNPRTESAIEYSIQRLKEFSLKKILDIGCGIGWSSNEFSRNIPDAKVSGVDLSGGLIAAANEIFKTSNVNFSKKDVTEKDFTEYNQFDAVILLDVYEHLPKDYRAFFHQSIKKVLSDKGIVILTCPSIYTQEDYRQNRPDLLQPVDEDVTPEDVAQLAQDLDGEVHSFEYITIWNQNDYFQATVRLKNAIFEENKIANILLEPKIERLINIKKSKFGSTLKEQNLTTRLKSALSFLYPIFPFLFR